MEATTMSPSHSTSRTVETNIEQLYKTTTCQVCGRVATRLVCIMEAAQRVSAHLFCETCYQTHTRER